MEYASSPERMTNGVPATIAWSAMAANAYSESTFPDDAFCLQLTVLNGEHHVYRLKRESLTLLFDRISQLLGKVDADKETSIAA